MLGRTVHGLAYDAAHDEIVVPNALADAVLVFRGDANGEAKPIRVIQGPHTHLTTPHAVSLDPDHGEILVASLTGKRINVYAWDANGDAAPLRVIEGPKTGLGHTVGVVVDTASNLLAVANTDDILIFNRTDSGNVRSARSHRRTEHRNYRRAVADADLPGTDLRRVLKSLPPEPLHGRDAQTRREADSGRPVAQSNAWIHGHLEHYG